MSNAAEQTPPRKLLAGLRRRPLLTPVWLTLLLGVLVVAAAAWFWSTQTTTTIIVVRHAEKELGTIDDPPLSQAGDQRAADLARLFGDRSSIPPIDMIFVSDTRRAARTAAPLAQRLGITPVVYPGRDVASLAQRIESGWRGHRVLVVGHSNTVPELVHALVPRVTVPPMPEGEYDTIYIATMPSLGPATVLRLKY
jgi:phosphohistidine phosphatase SixA